MSGKWSHVFQFYCPRGLVWYDALKLDYRGDTSKAWKYSDRLEMLGVDFRIYLVDPDGAYHYCYREKPLEDF